MLKDFPCWHQRLKLLTATFNVNPRINYLYSLRTTAPFIIITELATSNLDHSVDNFLIHFIFLPIFSQVQRLFIINEPLRWEFAMVAVGVLKMHH